MSARVSAVAALVGLAVAVAVVLVLVHVLTSPILPAPDGPPSFGPMPAATAPPSPITPDVSTAVPMHKRGPQALQATPEKEF